MLQLVGVIFVDWCQPVKSGQAYNFTCKSAPNEKHCLVSMDSDLEAFSRNPTHGSVAVLSFQIAAFTKYASRVFLSY